MIEKFSDYEKKGYLNQEGDFEFTVKTAELTASKAGDPMWKFECESDAGITTVYHSLNPKARWSFNGLIKSCLKLTPEKAKDFELDYQEVGHTLVGKTFVGHVKKESYEKEIKIPLDDGTYATDIEVKDSFKIDRYSEQLPF